MRNEFPFRPPPENEWLKYTLWCFVMIVLPIITFICVMIVFALVFRLLSGPPEEPTARTRLEWQPAEERSLPDKR